MKKISTRKGTSLPRELKQALDVELVRDEALRLEEERVAFERKQRMAHMSVRDTPRGWMDR